jgi:hypothetical protein
MTAPAVKLDAPAKNVRVIVERPSDRWLLWARGPAWGPAILFWGYLVLVLLVAAGLGRLHGPPLGTLDWLLLGVGLTQITAFEALCVLGLFFGLAKRATTVELPPWQHNTRQVAGALWVLLFAGSLFHAVQAGLLVQPDMQVMGAGSHDGSLQWYVDSSGPDLPRPTLVSVPMWVYRVAMLAWSLWLARKLLRWAPWAFRSFAGWLVEEAQQSQTDGARADVRRWWRIGDTKCAVRNKVKSSWKYRRASAARARRPGGAHRVRLGSLVSVDAIANSARQLVRAAAASGSSTGSPARGR